MCLAIHTTSISQFAATFNDARNRAPADKLLEEALSAAETIAGFSLPVIMMVKECVNRAYEGPLAEGMLFERRTFHAAFSLADKQEGMAAFVEKRKADFKNR
jgi:enoyl-CoA hydratase